MAQQKADMGRLATLGVLEVIRSGVRPRAAPLQTILDPTLIIRRTCGAPSRAPARNRAAEARVSSF